MHKVKYTRKEYRDDFLNSEEWKNVRDILIGNEPTCQRCKSRPSKDVHHLLYNEDVHLVDNNLICLCRQCHRDIHYALEVGLIDKTGEAARLKQDTLNLSDQDVKTYKEYRRKTHQIGEELGNKILDCYLHAQKQIFALIGVQKPRNSAELFSVCVTGAKIDKIKKLIELNPQYIGDERRFLSKKEREK